MDPGVLKALITVVGTLGGAWLVYKGSKFTVSKAKEGSDATTSVAAQESALDAWRGLLEPYRQEVASLRDEVGRLTHELREERQARAADLDAERKARAAEVDSLRERIGLLVTELGEWKRVAKVIAKWAMAMRDELLRQGGSVPATPDEILTLHAIDDLDNH